MRCPDCGTFVSYGDPEVEVSGEEVNDAQLQAEVQITLPCMNCGTELKQTTITLDEKVEHTCSVEEICTMLGLIELPELEGDDGGPCETCGTPIVTIAGPHQSEIQKRLGIMLPEVVGICPKCETEKYLDAHQEVAFEVVSIEGESDVRTEGKGRYTKTFYGAQIEAELTCERCGATVNLSPHVEEQASAYEELV
jgi:predicted nucleic-acid-binding Zn-ribbon protein